MYLQQIPLIAALEETHAALRETDEIVFRLLQLEQIHVEALVDGTAVEDELVRRDCKQRFGQLSDAVPVEVLQILRGHDKVGLFLSYPLEDIADILNDGGSHCDVVREPDIELVQDGGGIANSEQPIRHEGQDVEEHGSANAAIGLQESFDAEDDEAGEVTLVWPLKNFASAPLHME